MAFGDPGVVAAYVAAGAAILLVFPTYRQARLLRRSLDLSIRPLLTDPAPAPKDSPPDQILFGAPGRHSLEVPRGSLFYRGAGPESIFQLSLAFENIGPGAAVMLGVTTEPELPGSLYLSRKYVPAQEQVR